MYETRKVNEISQAQYAASETLLLLSEAVSDVMLQTSAGGIRRNLAFQTTIVLGEKFSFLMHLMKPGLQQRVRANAEGETMQGRPVEKLNLARLLVQHSSKALD